MITRHNYEIWFMDHLDGKLSPGQETMLQHFLRQNPDLAEELEVVKAEPMEWEDSGESFRSSALKKSIVPYDGIAEGNYEETFVAYHENDLDNAKKKSLEHFLLKNPVLVSEFDYLGKIRVSQTVEEFPRKEKLKKRPIVIPIYRYAAAASVLILLGVGSIRYVLVDQQVIAAAEMQKAGFILSDRHVVANENMATEISFPQKTAPNPSPVQQKEANKEKIIPVNGSESVAVNEVGYAMELKSPAPLINDKPMPTVVESNEMTLRQVVGKLIENGVGENGVSEGLENKERITGGDVADLAAAPFKNNEMPILSTTEDKRTGRRRVKFNLGFFEADFAVK